MIAQLACALAGKIAGAAADLFQFELQLGYVARSASVGLILTTDQTEPR